MITAQDNPCETRYFQHISLIFPRGFFKRSGEGTLPSLLWSPEERPGEGEYDADNDHGEQRVNVEPEIDQKT